MIHGITQLTISEDSDLLLYGCSKVSFFFFCIKQTYFHFGHSKVGWSWSNSLQVVIKLYIILQVLYKMGNEGDGILIDLANLPKVRTVKLASLTLEQFRWMCMLSGCDYLPSIKGMGLIKAFKLLQRHKSVKQVCMLHASCMFFKVVDSFKYKTFWRKSGIK